MAVFILKAVDREKGGKKGKKGKKSGKKSGKKVSLEYEGPLYFLYVYRLFQLAAYLKNVCHFFRKRRRVERKVERRERKRRRRRI